MNKRLMRILCVVLLAALVCGAVWFTLKTEDPVENAGTAQNAVEKQVSLTYQDQEYPLKRNIQTILLIGTDSEEPYRENDNKLQDYYNFNQADFLMLLVLDKDEDTAQIIQLNRDTMANVPWLDVLGNYGGTEYKQLCLAFNYGDGGEKSCKNTVDAVSGLLFEVPIQSYIQLPMSGIRVLNDLVGGVPVTIMEDMTAIDPAFTEGTTLRLTGTQAEQFVRGRMLLEDDTNVARMRRQRDYMDGFQTCAREAMDQDPDFALKLVETLANYMQSDLTAQQLSDLTQRLADAEVSPILSPEGELVLGEEFYEFYVDEASLWEIVKEACCD